MKQECDRDRVCSFVKEIGKLGEKENDGEGE